MSHHSDTEKDGSLEHNEYSNEAKSGAIAPTLSSASAAVAPEDRDEAYDFLKTVSDKSPWTIEEEKRIRRKVDLRVITVMFLNVALGYIDGATLGVAAIFGIIADAGLFEVTAAGTVDTTRYSNAAMMYYVGGIAGAYPISLCLQKFPIRICLAVLTMIWGISFGVTAACSTYGQIMAVRFILGFASASVLPSLALLQAQWYTKSEQATRTGIVVAASGFASIVSPLIGYGLFKIPNVTETLGGTGPWKVAFVFWGPLTFVWGIMILFIIPNNPFSAKFLNEREKYIAVERLRVEQSSVENRHVKKEQIWELVKDHRFWIWFINLIMISIDNGPVTSFTAIIIQNILGDPFQVLLLIVPIAALAAICMVAFGMLAAKIPNIRTWIIIGFLVPPVVSLALLWKLSVPDHKWGLYVCTILNPLFSVSYAQHVSFGVSNVAGYTKKTFVAGAILVGYNIGAIIGPLLFLGTEAPTYPTAFKTVLAIMIAAMAMSVLYWFECRRENRRREALGAAAHKDRAFLDLTDKENLTFRYTL